MDKHFDLNVLIIMQARMGSTRLPGKVLKEVRGKPLMHYEVERLRRVSLARQLVIATTTHLKDQPVIDYCLGANIPFFRGSEEDVLNRYYCTAREFGADVIVRVTADCPLIDPEVVDQVIHFYLENYPQYDYVSNTLERTFPRGMDVEVFSFPGLSEAEQQAQNPVEREHVTPFFYRYPNKFHLGSIKNITDQSRYRLTVDTPEDFELIRRILEVLYPENPNFSLKDVLGLLERNPDWAKINSDVQQKVL